MEFGHLYLKRLTISGFKSFAAKTQLEFEPGITAVVGPNGSGKSNIADAVRWALGEQSTKLLRMRKGDEVVFAGTDKRSKASMAEVSLLLDNSDGLLPIEFTEVELSRVVYRSGESEYRLNGRRVKLSEIQHLLAAAGFGQNSYAVIGQGMIDTFIISTPAERKMLFDEASGIRQYEIKREQALKKLDATSGNLERVKEIIKELEPRVRYLAKAAESSQQRQLLRDELDQKRALYAATADAHYRQKQDGIRVELRELKEARNQLGQEIKKLEHQRSEIEAAKSRPVVADTLRELEIERDELVNEVSVKRAELQFLLEKYQEQEGLLVTVQNHEATLEEARSARGRLREELRQAQAAEAELADQLKLIAEDIRTGQANLSNLRDQLRETSNGEFVKHALSILRHVARDTKLNIEQIRDLVSRAGRLLLNASFGEGDLAKSIRKAQSELGESMRRRESAHNAYTNAVIKVRSLEMDITANADFQAGVAAQIKDLRRQTEERHKTQSQADLRRRRITEAEGRLQIIDAELESKRQEVMSKSAGPDANSIFALASRLEDAKYRLRQITEQEQALSREEEEAKSRLTQLAMEAKRWFGDSVPEVKPGREPLERMEHQLAVLEGRVAEGGDGDATVAEEYGEVRDRHEFLSEQVLDLESAKVDLQKVIAQLDKLIQAKFETGFAAIARYFSQNFERLFDGGAASLSLRPGEDGAYGIEIKATPPGKRVESLSTLSGGERALTGIALLAAILEANPSPFVVMDEVDAALDEANSAKLGSVLSDIAKKSQLVVITHNRAVMQAAHSIYGVTMDSHHVSRLLSIKLEEAKDLVAAE